MQISSLIPRWPTTATAVAVGLLVACAATFERGYTVSLRDLEVQPRAVQVATAATSVLVDAPESWILDQESQAPDFASLTKRAELFGTLIATAPVERRIARRLGIAEDDLAAVKRLTAGVPTMLREPDAVQRVTQILQSTKRHQIELQSDPYRPVLHIYTQAPTVATAEGLADAAVLELREELGQISARGGLPPLRQARVEQLGPARGGIANAGTGLQVAVLTFLVAFCVTLGLVLLAGRTVVGWRRAGRASSSSAGEAAGAPGTPPVERRRAAGHARAASGGDWPRTTRVLPWMVAGFMVVLWLVPFNTIELSASLPFDLQLDRLVLPVIVATWVLALAAGGVAAPRIRITWIHGAAAAFVAIACLGVVVDAPYLARTLELETSTKQLTLVISYLVLLVMVASIVRRAEVPAFFTFTLVLAVLCAVGTVWEYRFQYNAFYQLSDKLLPSLFDVGAAESAAVDGQGRFLTRGPGEHPLEAVAMLTMAFPIALVGMMTSKQRRTTVLYALAACVLMAAAISTYRKSALLAPLAVVLTVAYFRRRELLRLAPLGVVAVLFVNALSPGALSAIFMQLQLDQLGVGTVSDRTSDYDAVRPDLWSHLAFGRGFGSYDHVSYRMLDSEILGRLVDMGILGLASLVLMLGAFVLAARRLIVARHPVWSGPALAVAAAAVGYFVLAFLFDISSFPHAPYILMSLAAMLAVIVGHDAEEVAEEPPADPVDAGVEWVPASPVRTRPAPRRRSEPKQPVAG